MYECELRKSVAKIFRKLSKKDPEMLKSIQSKIGEIRQNPHHYKNLKAPMNYLIRVHIRDQFVLTYSVDDNMKLVVIEDFDHRDNIYS